MLLSVIEYPLTHIHTHTHTHTHTYTLTGWWVPGHVHKPPGDSQDQAAGGRRDGGHSTCWRCPSGQGAWLYGPVQGGCGLYDVGVACMRWRGLYCKVRV